MLHYAVVFFVSLMISVLGFGATAGLSRQMGRLGAVMTIVLVFLTIALLGGAVP